jgi:Pyridoxamine 5'-phosphate oxidase
MNLIDNNAEAELEIFMNELTETAPAFVEMAHRIVWASVATVDAHGRPRSRILHPIWQWDEDRLVGWVGTSPTPLKRAHLKANSYMSVNYWSPTHDTCVAECAANWAFDNETRTIVWNLFLNTPEPLGYNPRIIPAWESPTCDAFAAIRLDPWRLRVFPGSVLLGKGGKVLTWQR